MFSAHKQSCQLFFILIIYKVTILIKLIRQLLILSNLKIIIQIVCSKIKLMRQLSIRTIFQKILLSVILQIK